MALERVTERTTASTVRFDHAATIGSDPRELPPGTCPIYRHEYMYVGLGEPVFHAVSVELIIQASGRTTTRTVRPDDLRSALVRDAETDASGDRGYCGS